MSFLKPEKPKPLPTVLQPTPLTEETDSAGAYQSLISTGTSGLRRKASTQKASLIGGS